MRRFILLAAKIAVSAALLYLALRKVDLADLWSRINRDSFGWLGLAIGVTLLQIFVGALRWREITDKCAVPLTVRQVVRFNMIGSFFNQALPSSIGGDAFRIWLVKNSGAGWRDATYSVFVDRAIGMMALAAIVIVSLPWSYQLFDNSQGRLALLVIDLIVLGMSLGFLLLGRLPWPWLKTWWLTHHPYNCSVIANRVIFDRSSGPKIVVLSLLVHLLYIFIAWCVVQSIHAAVTSSSLALLIPPVALTTMLPISIAGWGVRETAMMVAFGYAGLAQHDGVNVSLLLGAVSFAVGAIGGIVWIFSAEKMVRPIDGIVPTDT